MNSENFLSHRICLTALLLTLILLLFTGCSSTPSMETDAPGEPGSANETDHSVTTEPLSEDKAASSHNTESDAPERTDDMILTQASSQKFDFEKQTVLLNSGYEMPVIGLGTWTLNDDEEENSVYHALKSGMYCNPT